MKKIVLALFSLVVLSSCGYTMAGFNNSIPVKYYINTVNNTTYDTQLTDIVQLEAERFFINYNELASYKKASYFMDIQISDLKFINPILSASDEASSTNISMQLTIIVTDLDGKEIYTWSSSISESFTITSKTTTTIQNREQALIKGLEDALTTFRINISPKVYITN